MEDRMEGFKDKYVFTQYGDGHRVVVSSREVFLPDIVGVFTDFLKGCGFQFERLDIIKEEFDNV